MCAWSIHVEDGQDGLIRVNSHGSFLGSSAGATRYYMYSVTEWGILEAMSDGVKMAQFPMSNTPCKCHGTDLPG